MKCESTCESLITSKKFMYKSFYYMDIRIFVKSPLFITS